MKMQFKRHKASNVAKPRFSMQAVGSEATVYVYDAIGEFWGVSAQEFVRQLNMLDVETIHLRINSPGGDVFAAKAMATALRAHAAHVVAHIDGVAASAATTLAIAADEVRMSEGAFFMIHNAFSFAMGDATEMRKMADMLEKVNASIVAEYVAKTGKSVEQINTWMNAETWFSASEAKAEGFIDYIDHETGQTSNLWDVSGYRNAPQALLETPSNDETFNIEHLRRNLQLLEKSA
jgi:ATP-dependent Clp protease protease subunit